MTEDVNIDGFDFPSYCREEEARIKIEFPDISDMKLADLLAERIDVLVRTGKIVVD